MSITYKYRPPKPPSPPLTGAGRVLGKQNDKDVLAITYDTREQLPLSFPGGYVVASRGTVDVFDYCLTGDTGWACERKSLNDYVQAVVLRDSWRRELAKIDKASAWLLPLVWICEFALEDIAAYDYTQFRSGRVQSGFVYSRTAELIFDRGVTLVFCGNREMASYMVAKLIKRRKESLRSKQ